VAGSTFLDRGVRQCAACSVPALREWNHPQGQFSGLAVISLFAIVVAVIVVIAIVAAIRTPMAYGIGLALVSVPALWFVSISARDVAQRAGAEGWGRMTFMRLTLENGHANHDVLAVLLRNGIDPDQDSSLLYQMIYSQKDEALLRVVIDSGVDLSKHMGRGNWFYFVGYDWPEGLALVLHHGADTEAQDPMGYTEIMRATRAQSWPTVESLLAHGARTDHVANDGRSLRDLLPEAIAGYRGEIPPRIAALRESLR
jgi:hypothetical protein